MLHIQNNNQESLWYHHSYGKDSHCILQKLSPECVPKVLYITDFNMLRSQFLGSKIQKLCVDFISKYSNAELSLVSSWLPRLTDVSLKCSRITDRGLEALAKCCSSLEVVNIAGCCWITDSGINFLLQNCCKLRSLIIDSCSSITEGIEEIVSGGGLEDLDLSAKASEVRGSTNTEAVITISKRCPLLKKLYLLNCEGIEIKGWEAIGRNCKNLEHHVFGCTKLCDLGLQALFNGCNKLSRLYIDNHSSCFTSLRKTN
ncbi:hypothetical protein MKW92_051284 [Papaver armeniacum]|nr:hypothetical protein MKW92_051284 [Papaver armeniacum]